tara:strand:- start:207 stop:1205 length:999 start_codon:yes stop_codon:yes gene_type:complete
MKLGDFIKQEDVKRTSSYKVVVGNSPKEQELKKEASKVESLSQNLQDLQIRYDNIFDENEFFKKQVTRHQNDLDITKGKLEDQTDLQKDLINKENSMTLLKEEIHELSILKNNNKEKIKDLSIQLNDKTGEAERFEIELKNYTELQQELNSKYNGIISENNSIKDFSEKIQNDYNKVRERNTVLLKEREDLSKLKSEFEAKSIRLGEELRKAQENNRTTKDKLENLINKDNIRDKETITSNNLHTKLKVDLKKLKSDKSKGFNELYTKVNNFLYDKNQIKVDRETKERLQAMEWNVAKQELKLGNASTYPNKLGFGASTFFKLNNEENIDYG